MIWSSILLTSIGTYGPLVLTLLTFHDLVVDPVHNLAMTLPVVLLLTVLSSHIQYRRSIADTVLSLGRLIIYFIPATYFIVVLMGAPFTTHVAQTILFSSHLATMVFYKAILKLGLDRNQWMKLLPSIPDEQDDTSETQDISKTVGGTGLEGIVWGTLAGAYLGAVPIPLDWDREWQKWPVTVHIGACIGLAIGGTVQLIYDSVYKQANATKTLKDKKVK